MVDPKVVFESEVYKEPLIFMVRELTENRDVSIVKLASRCSFLCDEATKEAYPPSSKWQVFMNGQNITLINRELRDENGASATVTMKHWDFIQQVTMRGVPMNGTYIDTPVVFFKLSDEAYYSIEVEGSPLHEALKEGLEKGFGKRIKTLKPGTVYNVLNRCLSQLKPTVIGSRYGSSNNKSDILELLYIGKDFYIQDDINANVIYDPDEYYFREESFFKLGGKINLRSSRYGVRSNCYTTSSIHLFKDMVSGEYWFSNDKGYSYFPFEKLYAYDRWQGEEVEIQRINEHIGQTFQDQMDLLSQRVKEIYNKFQTFSNYKKEMDGNYKSNENLSNVLPSQINIPFIYKERVGLSEINKQAIEIFSSAINRNAEAFTDSSSDLNFLGH